MWCENANTITPSTYPREYQWAHHNQILFPESCYFLNDLSNTNAHWKINECMRFVEKSVDIFLLW